MINNNCKLYTLDGVKDATATQICDKQTRIESNAGDFTIIVFTALAKHKFDQETMPTFYAC